MNFNSDYQSNQNRLCNSEVVNLSLNAMKTKTKLNTGYKALLRVLCEIAFVFIAIALGYMQGLKSFTAYKEGALAKTQRSHAGAHYAGAQAMQLQYFQKKIPE